MKKIYELDASTINNVKDIKKYYKMVSTELDRIVEDSFYDNGLDLDELKRRTDILDKLMYQLRIRYYEIETPGLSDGIIDLYLDKPNHYTICKFNECIPVGEIEYCDTNRCVPGNISYIIYDEYQGNHYALRALNLVGKVLLDKGVKSIFITANRKDNIPSIKTILAFGGELYKESNDDGPVPYQCDLETIYKKKLS